MCFAKAPWYGDERKLESDLTASHPVAVLRSKMSAKGGGPRKVPRSTFQEASMLLRRSLSPHRQRERDLLRTPPFASKKVLGGNLHGLPPCAGVPTLQRLAYVCSGGHTLCSSVKAHVSDIFLLGELSS